MSRRALITGGSGFVGQWMSRAMLEHGWSVYAGMTGETPRDGILSAKEREAVCWTRLDVTSDASIRAALDTGAPDVIVHLAGIAFAPQANASPVRAFEVNALGVVRLLSALPSPPGDLRVLVVGSAEQYGAQESSAYPIAETAMMRPLTPYAVAKAAQELIALQAGRANGLRVVCSRSFNHSGVGHGARYLLPTLVRQVCALPRSGGTVRIGNDTVVRDYLHVTDVVNAYMLLLQRGTPGEVYNVCSGHGSTVREIVDRVLKRAAVTADISSDSELFRAMDVPILVGDNSKLRTATDWAPQRSLDDIIDDLIHAAPR